MREFWAAILSLMLIACSDEPDINVESATLRANLWVGAASVSLLNPGGLPVRDPGLQPKCRA